MVVRAPAGYGKSSILAHWRQELISEGVAVGWITIDASDNDPELFSSAVESALNYAGKTKGHDGAIIRREWRSGSGNLDGLVEALAEIDREFVLIFDEVQQIRSRASVALLQRLVSNPPPNLKIVLAGRFVQRDIIKDLNSWTDLLEIGGSDFQLSLEETCELMENEAAEFDLDEIARLHYRTEGWIGGIQIAVFASKIGRYSSKKLVNLSAFEGETHRYLNEQVLKVLSQEEREFLVQSCIFDRFTPRMCDFVFGRTDSEELVEKIIQRHIFVETAVEGEFWCRYHSLFTEFLRGLNQKLMPEEERAEAFSKATDWLLKNDYREDAMNEAAKVDAVALNDLQSFASGAALASQAQASRIERLAYPNLTGAKPSSDLRLATLAWSKILRGQAAEALSLLSGEKRAEIDFRVIQTVAKVILGRSNGDIAELNALAEEANGDQWWTGLYRVFVKYANTLDGSFERVRKFPSGGDELEKSLAVAINARSWRLQGFLGKSEEILRTRNAEGVGEHRFNDVADLTAIAYHAELLSVRGAIKEAQLLLAGRVTSFEKLFLPDAFVAAWQARIRALLSNDLTADALDGLSSAVQVCSDREWTVEASLLDAEQVPIYLRRGDVLSAQKLVSDLEERELTLCQSAGRCQASMGRHRGATLLARAWTRIENGYPRDADRDAQEALAAFQGLGDRVRKIEAVCLQAVAAEYSADWSTASRHLIAALELARPDNIRRPFIDFDWRVRPLLSRLIAENEVNARNVQAVAFAKALLANDPPPTEATSEPAPEIVQQIASLEDELIEPLSKREVDVLRMVEGGLSNKQVAFSLSIGEETVKWHLKNAFSKLQVDNRTAAVASARRNGFLA